MRVRPFVRQACRFASHNLPASPPFSRLDLIVCRGALASIATHARKSALGLWHAALSPGGVLLDETGLAAGAPEIFAPGAGGGSYVALKSSAPPRSPAGWISDDKLRESDDKLRVLFSEAKEAIFVRDAESDLILEANDAAQALCGWCLPELWKMRGKDLLAAPESVRRPKAERRSEERLRLPHFRRKDGSVFAAVTSSSFVMLQGRPCHLWIVRDATQELRLGSARRREAEQAAFIGDIVHELRSPIAVIQGSAETLRLGGQGGRSRSTFLKYIENHAARMALLVDRLLDLSGGVPVKRAPAPAAVNLAEAIWEIASTFVPIAKRRGVSIKIDIPIGLTVLADPAGLPHVFGNLLDNATKFTPRGGKVFLQARAEDGEGILSVRDTGGGIAPTDLSRIFERFYRGESARRKKGAGLGLAIVHGIVKANHGRVFAENDPKGGAVFHVALPLAGKGKS